MGHCEIRMTREAWDKLSPEEKRDLIQMDREARDIDPFRDTLQSEGSAQVRMGGRR